MAGAGPLESDTCRDYVLPRLRAAGWDIDNQVIEQFPITDGRIIAHGKKHRREKPLRADYVLEYRPGVPVAVVEAKREYTIPGKGLQQAKRYGDLLDIPFRFATNGKGIVEDDRDTGLRRGAGATLRVHPRRGRDRPRRRGGRPSAQVLRARHPGLGDGRVGSLPRP